MSDDGSYEAMIRKMATGGKVEPSADMRDAARGLRGFYTAFTEVGFSEDEALRLVMNAMTRGREQ